MNITRDEAGHVTQNGNVTRVVHGAPSPETQSPLHGPLQTSKVNTGPLRYEGGEVVAVGVTRHQVGSEATKAGSVVATLQRVGANMTVELVPGVPGSRTLVSAALRDGVIRETAPGHYEDVAAATQPTPAAADQQSQQAATEAPLFDQQEAGIWLQEIAPLPQPAYDSAVAGTVADILSGGDYEGTVKALAEAGGLEQERAREFVETGVDWYTQTLTRDLVKQGLCTNENASEFYDSIRRHPHLSQALQELAFEGKTDTFRTLALGWKRDASLRTQAAMRDSLQRQGMQTTVDPHSGELLVSRDGGSWVPLGRL